MYCLPAHPRVCGENFIPRSEWPEEMGSSPRVRGKHAGVGDVRRFLGLIPACAGKTCVFAGRASRDRAHPRVCGENSGIRCAPETTLGSSPRVRGKPIRRAANQPIRGLIPACAGKTISSLGFISVFPAHPRVCGENVGEYGGGVVGEGSSPRVRGKQLPENRTHWNPGLIPACAGKTQFSRRDIIRKWAHPRVCGENGFIRLAPAVLAGSSPRVRGKH